MEPRRGFEPATSALPTQAFDELLVEFERFCAVDLELSPVTVKDHNVLARHYTDYNPRRLKKIHDANLKVLA